MNNKVDVIFGLGQAGLFLARQLNKAGRRVIGICRHDDIGQYSNSIEKYFIAEDNENLINIINKISKEYSILKCYVCSDQYITMLLKSEIQLNLLFSEYEIQNLKLINDKNKVSNFCRELGFEIPEEKTLNQVVGKTKEVKYPIILKFNRKQIDIKKNPIGKTKVVFKQKELEELINKINQSKINMSDILVQRYLTGNNNNQLSFGGYFENGSCIAGIVVNQLQQYPQGISALVVESTNDDAIEYITSKVKELAHKIKYSGFLEMEFKYADNDNKCYLLDINPRTWGWVSILGTKYPDFCRVFEGEKEIMRSSKPVLWQSKYRRFKGRGNNKNVKFNRTNEYLIASDIYDSKDIKPSIMIFKIGLQKIIRRCWN